MSLPEIPVSADCGLRQAANMYVHVCACMCMYVHVFPFKEYKKCEIHVCACMCMYVSVCGTIMWYVCVSISWPVGEYAFKLGVFIGVDRAPGT